jgi:hypothetical protein
MAKKKIPTADNGDGAALDAALDAAVDDALNRAGVTVEDTPVPTNRVARRHPVTTGDLIRQRRLYPV